MKKRILSLFLVLVMALSLLPATAVAAEPSEPVQQEEISRGGADAGGAGGECFHCAQRV